MRPWMGAAEASSRTLRHIPKRIQASIPGCVRRLARRSPLDDRPAYRLDHAVQRRPRCRCCAPRQHPDRADPTCSALRRRLALTRPGHPRGWYAAFLRWIVRSRASALGPAIPIAEITVGALLILGLFTGIAAFLAGMLTMSFGLAGVAGVNPVFFLFEVLLILAWRNAGYIGLDRWVLPALGTPWRPGPVFQRRAVTERRREPA